MTVSSGLSLAFMVIGLLAVVFALVVVWRRTTTPGTPSLPQAQTAQDRTQIDTATQEAERIRGLVEPGPQPAACHGDDLGVVEGDGRLPS